MKVAIRSGFRKARAQSRRWLRHHPKLARLLDLAGCLETGNHSIARGAGAGLFVALVPVFGAQTILLLMVCVIARANFPIAYLASWVSNPFTIGPLAVAANSVGRVAVAPVTWPFDMPAGLAKIAVEQTLVTLLGSLVIAIPAALIGYAFTLWVQERFRTRR